MGAYLEHVTQDDPERKARLMKNLMASWSGTVTGNCSTYYPTTDRAFDKENEHGRNPTR